MPFRKIMYWCVGISVVIAVFMVNGGDVMLWRLVKKMAIYGFESATVIVQGVLSRSW